MVSGHLDGEVSLGAHGVALEAYRGGNRVPPDAGNLPPAPTLHSGLALAVYPLSGTHDVRGAAQGRPMNALPAATSLVARRPETEYPA